MQTSTYVSYSPFSRARVLPSSTPTFWWLSSHLDWRDSSNPSSYIGCSSSITSSAVLSVSTSVWVVLSPCGKSEFHSASLRRVGFYSICCSCTGCPSLLSLWIRCIWFSDTRRGKSPFSTCFITVQSPYWQTWPVICIRGHPAVLL